MDAESEKDFNEWMNSIDFVDDKGIVIKPELTEDITEDPEGDRS